MSRIQWNTVGQRHFTTGVEKGVLYVHGNLAVPWNGLISVSESSEGGSVSSFYVDGIKYAERLANESFRATLVAFTYPEEFEHCSGEAEVANGLIATRQNRCKFNLSYKTLIGNDIDGPNHEYRIHLVYNAMATPTTKVHATLADGVEPHNFTWEISAQPPRFKGLKPTAHFIIDTHHTPQDLLNEIEDILYGTEMEDPRMPSVEELFYIFQDHQTSVFDAGYLTETYYNTLDSETITVPQTSTIDGGSP